LILGQLLTKDSKTLRKALEIGVKENIIPPLTPEAINNNIREVENLRPRYLNLRDLPSFTRLKLSSEILEALEKKNIHTLTDVRTATANGELDNLGISTHSLTIQRLKAHSALLTLSRDITLNDKLIKKGYTNISTITDIPQANFVEAIHNQIGDFKAAQLYEEAVAETAFLNKALTELLIERTNNLISQETQPLITSLAKCNNICYTCF
jgi:hypothetical protein